MIFGRAQGSHLHSAAIDFNHSVVSRFWEEAFFQELSRKLSDTQNNGIERWHSEEEQLQAVLPFFTWGQRCDLFAHKKKDRCIVAFYLQVIPTFVLC